MPKFKVKRIEPGYDTEHEIVAISASDAAERLIAREESRHAEYIVASGEQSAIVEVEGHGQFEVYGNPAPSYRSRRR